MSNNTTAHQYKILTRELQNFLEMHDWNYYVTFVFNRDLTSIQAKEFIKKWDARLSCKTLGPRWAAKPLNKRNFFFAFYEHRHSNLHLHSAFKAPQQEALLNFGEDIWKELVPSGDLDIRAIGSGKDNLRSTVSYLLKETWKKNNFEDFIISSEFHPF